MPRLTEEAASTFRAVKEACYAGHGGERLMREVGVRLERDLRLTAYCLGVLDATTSLPVQSISVGLAPGAMESFFRLILTTPTLDFGPWTSRRERVRRLEDLVDNLATDPYMTDILRPSGLRYEVQVSCASAGTAFGHLCLRRRERDGAFEGHELRLLDAIAPHLAAGLRAAGVRAAATASPAVNTGVIVLGPDGEVELANGVSERLLSRPEAGSRQSYVTAVNLVAARLKHALTTDGVAAIPVLTLTDERSGEAYRLRSERVPGADGRPRGLITIEPAARAEPSTWSATLVRMGLTAREAEVALSAVRGQTAHQIAEQFVISPYTVRDHLRNAYEKLGVHSRNELAMCLIGAAAREGETAAVAAS